MATRSSSRIKSQTSNQTPINSGAIKKISKLRKRDPVEKEKEPEPEPETPAVDSEQAGPDEVELKEREPISAFLRIRPQLDSSAPLSPYLIALSDTTVSMSDKTSDSNRRLRNTIPETQYKFTHVFPSTTRQNEFFARTTVPLIEDLLVGRNALLFAYGVTNSGKTYSIQGNPSEHEAGILPRTLEVVFRSIAGHESTNYLKPTRVVEVERLSKASFEAQASETSEFIQSRESDVFGKLFDSSFELFATEDTAISIESEYEYSVWVSYAEIYNERVFDLLGKQVVFGKLQKSTSNFLSSAPRTGSTNSRIPHQYSVRRKALSLKSDGYGGKYIAGLRELRIDTAEQGRQILKIGQLNRRVFGTLANQASSRSHAIFTIKVLRVPKREGEKGPQAIQVSRLSIVDLAGSERTKVAQTSGERLKEAGSINRSLMVLGQCLETLRANQKRKAHAAISGRNATPKLAVVPFRDSKLTEVFQDFFAGNGRASMIVNVNPYDTGFDENSQVMKFSAIAREVSTVTSKTSSAERRRTVRLSLADESYDALFDILEEIGTEEDEVPINPLVDSLFDEIEMLRKRLHESEERAARLEIDIREEITKDLTVQMKAMEDTYNQRLHSELEHTERKMDKKIDLLYRGGHFDGIVTANETSLASNSCVSRGEDDDIFIRPPPDSQTLSNCSHREKQQPGDLGLFEHDDRSAIETDETKSDTEFSEDDRPRRDDEASDPDDEDCSEEYIPSSNGSGSRRLASISSTHSEDSIDFLSPSKKGTLSRDPLSTLNQDMDNLSFCSS